MVILDFQPLEEALQVARRAGVVGLSAAEVSRVYFVLPVRLHVDGVELLERAAAQGVVFVCAVEQEALEPVLEPILGDPWFSAPVLHFAAGGLKQAVRAAQGEAGIYFFPNGGNLAFHPQGKQVEVSSSISQRAARAGGQELVEAFEAFSGQVREFILREMPELRDV